MDTPEVLARIEERLSAIETRMNTLGESVAAIRKEVGNDLPHQIADMDSKLDNLTEMVSAVHQHAIPDAK